MRRRCTTLPRATRSSGPTCRTGRSTRRRSSRSSTPGSRTILVFNALCPLPEERPAGVASYMNIVPEHGRVEIGHIWFGPALQRTRAATEAIYLMADHAFEELGYRRLEWLCNSLNERSRRAAERFGFTFEGIARQHMFAKGHNRDTAWFSITDNEWPRAGASASNAGSTMAISTTAAASGARCARELGSVGG